MNTPNLEVKSVAPSVWGIKWGKNWFTWAYTNEARAKEVMAKLMLREAKALKINFSHHLPILKQDVF